MYRSQMDFKVHYLHLFKLKSSPACLFELSEAWITSEDCMEPFHRTIRVLSSIPKQVPISFSCLSECHNAVLLCTARKLLRTMKLIMTELFPFWVTFPFVVIEKSQKLRNNESINGKRKQYFLLYRRNSWEYDMTVTVLMKLVQWNR